MQGIIELSLCICYHFWDLYNVSFSFESEILCEIARIHDIIYSWFGGFAEKQFVVITEGGGGGGNLLRFWVGMCPIRTKSRPITRAKFFIKNTKNL